MDLTMGKAESWRWYANDLFFMAIIFLQGWSYTKTYSSKFLL